MLVNDILNKAIILIPVLGVIGLIFGLGVMGIINIPYLKDASQHNVHVLPSPPPPPSSSPKTSSQQPTTTSSQQSTLQSSTGGMNMTQQPTTTSSQQSTLQSSTSNDANLKVYSGRGIRISYPNSWNQDTNSKHLVSFSDPQQNPHESLYVDIDSQQNVGESLGQLFSDVKKDISNSKDYKIVSSSKGDTTTLLGRNAYSITYKSKGYQYLEVGTIVDKTAYFITYSAPEQKFNNNLQIFQTMKDSFKIT